MASSAESADITPSSVIGNVAEELRKYGVIYDTKSGKPKNVNIPRVVEILTARVAPVSVPNGEIYTYDGNGLWVPNGAALLEGLLVNVFHGIVNDKGLPIYTVSVKNQIMYDIRAGRLIKPEKFDANPEIINLANGLYNWQTGLFEPHTGIYLSRVQLPVFYDSEATCPHIDKMIEVVARPEDRTKLYELAAYLMYRGYPIQKIFVLLGPGGTGKSVFLDILVEFLGRQNCASVSMQELSKDRFASSDLDGKLANVCSDLDQAALRETAILKRLSSNKDVIRAQRKCLHAFNFVSHARLIFSCNQLPPTPDDTTGFYRRFEIIPFEHVFTREEHDQTFLEELTSPEELSGLFNKVVGLLPALLERHEFTNGMSIDQARSRYKEMSQPEEIFFDMFVQEELGHPIAKDVLYAYYLRYCEVLKVPPLSSYKFGRVVRQQAEWVQARMEREGKDKANFSTTRDGKSVAVWPDTGFDEEKFEVWVKAHTP